MRNSKPYVLAMALCFVFTLAGCSGNKPANPPNDTVVSPDRNDTIQADDDLQESLFRIEVLSSGLAGSLSTTQSVVQYDGQTQLIPHEHKPGEGNVFLIVEMVVEKQKTGAGSFRWANVSVTDADGKVYSRHPNDTFLELHNYSRMKSTDLNFGRNEGFVCFEITRESSEQSLWLVYTAEDGNSRIALHP